jgi:hypothetical protein
VPVSVAVDGTCWGSFWIFRAAPADFTAQEEAFAHELAAMLGRGFRTALAHAGSSGTASSSEPGLMLLAGNRRVESITVAARAWLNELGAAGGPRRG